MVVELADVCDWRWCADGWMVGGMVVDCHHRIDWIVDRRRHFLILRSRMCHLGMGHGVGMYVVEL